MAWRTQLPAMTGGVGSKWRGYGRGAGVVEGTATRDDRGGAGRGVSGVGIGVGK